MARVAGTIGFIGLGVMGKPMAKHLVAGGHSLVVHNRSRAAVDELSNGHPVTRIDSGREPVWRIAPENEHTAAFYRNSVIHAFLETSIVALALAHAGHADGNRLEAFWNQAMRLRDLLKFDFYFADSAAF